MKSSDIKISELKTIKQMSDAIREIESDWRNIVGGSDAFFSGKQTFLNVAAQNKVNVIHKRIAELEGDFGDE